MFSSSFNPFFISISPSNSLYLKMHIYPFACLRHLFFILSILFFLSPSYIPAFPCFLSVPLFHSCHSSSLLFFSFVWYLSSFYFSPVHVFQVDFSVFSPSHYFSSPFSHSFISLFSIFSISLHLPIYLSSSLSCCHQKNYLSLPLSLTFSLPLSLKDEIIFSALTCFKKGAVISFLFFSLSLFLYSEFLFQIHFSHFLFFWKEVVLNE